MMLALAAAAGGCVNSQNDAGHHPDAKPDACAHPGSNTCPYACATAEDAKARLPSV